MKGKNDFIDAYVTMFGGTKREARGVFKSASEEYIKSVIGWFETQCIHSFYEN